METIEKILEEWDWKLKVFQSRYGKGVWATLLPNKPYSDEIEEHIIGGDMLAMPMISYLRNEGLWLPVVFAASLSKALDCLDEKAAVLKEQSDWRKKVDEAIDELIEGNITYADIEYTPNFKSVVLQPMLLELIKTK